LIPTAVGAGKVNRDLMQINPVGKIPTLVLGDGTVVHDSTVIIDYFDTCVPAERRLIPASGKARIRALRMNAMAEGMVVAGVLVRNELNRAEENRWRDFQQAQLAKIQQCLSALDQEIQSAPAQPTIGEIAVGTALGWINLRMPDIVWQDRCPALSNWYAAFSQRPAMVATQPQ